MIDHGKVRSTVKPEGKVIDEFSVWVNTGIQEIQITNENGQHTEYEFDQVQYSKDEYIASMDKKNADMEKELTNTQLALCDIFEMMEEN